MIRASIKHGSTRIVLLIAGLAFKVPSFVSWRLFLSGLLANMQERQFSRMSDRLCPVLFHVPGGFLTVMRRAEPLTRDEYFGMDVGDFLDGGDFVLPVEDKLCSFGKVGGRIVAVDYGS